MKGLDWDTLFRLLTLDKKSKQKLIDSNPTLKKHISDNTFKRKPKRLNSPLAKKLETTKHRLTQKYYSLKDIYQILELEEFDELRKKNYIATYEDISKIPDKQEKNYQLSQLYSQIKKDVKYFIGHEENPMLDLPVEDQIQQGILLGSKEFKE